ncbi:bactofilin family protein [Occallatibacter riparius]|uniref:Polymer-forming cytoskeletal protein n=1 Tax=Occallatibacter riparius TaxID=1002689 RepID=A0A9J7BPP4_9BACT|nr:polymer-forming cytoskeletal protein [Occallatibacter riparius]UWZ84680.1 polymer-forming cytoskeletal protein [Occallatibacter riparius]
MWKQKPENVSVPAFVPIPEPVRPAAPLPAADARPRAAFAGSDQTSLNKGIVVKGHISGTDPLFIDCTVEGTISIPGERVTIGKNGHVIAAKSGEPGPCITAREIVILGSVTGSVFASDRVDLRAQASLAGDVSTARVSIEDGAYFRGGIDIRRDQKPAQPATAEASSADAPAEAQPAEAVEVQLSL